MNGVYQLNPSLSLRMTDLVSRGVHKKNCTLFKGVTAIVLVFVLNVADNSLALDAVSIGEIKVEEELERESKEAPSSFTTVIKTDKIPEKSDSLAEIVSESPGVRITETGGPGHFSTVSIRGSTAEQVSVFVDGVRLNTSLHGAVDFSTVPTGGIERVEVIRGGGTAQFGPDAIGGVINIITKGAKEGRNIDFSIGGGSFTTLKTMEAWRERLKRWGFVVSHSHMQSDGNYSFKSAGTLLSGTPSPIGGGQIFTRIHNSFLTETLLTKFDVDLKDDIHLNFSNDFLFTARDVPGMEEETTILYPNNPLEAEERIIRSLTTIAAGLDRFFLDNLSLKLALTNGFNFDRFKDPSPAIGGPIDTRTYNDSIAPYVKLDYLWENRHLPQILTLRYDYKRDILKDTVIGKMERSSHSVFFQDEIHAFKEMLTLVPALRFDYASDYPHNVSLKFGAAGKPLKWLTIKGNVESSYRFPNFSELYYPDQGYLRGNPDLEKEESINIDGGIIITLPFLSIEGAYFRNDVSNQIIWVPISATTIQPVNTYDVDIQGVEASLTLDPVKYIHFEGNYTYTKANFASNDLQLPGRPRHSLDARLALKYDWGDKFGASIFGDLQYLSRLSVNTQNTVFVAPRTRIDLGASVKFLKNWHATFEAKDITNVQIYDARGFPLPRRRYFLTLGADWTQTKNDARRTL